MRLLWEQEQIGFLKNKHNLLLPLPYIQTIGQSNQNDRYKSYS